MKSYLFTALLSQVQICMNAVNDLLVAVESKQFVLGH